MPSFQTTIELPIEVEYEYSAGQEPTREEPDCAPGADVESVVIFCPALQSPAALRFHKLDRAERRRIEAEALAHAGSEESAARLERLASATGWRTNRPHDIAPPWITLLPKSG